MASLKQHMEDCTKLIGAPHEEVHRWIDEFSQTVGPTHRKYRHHLEGIEEARKIFGDSGAAAAIVHVLRDCRNIPHANDYASGEADALGLKKQWPVSAYVRYPEEAFEALARYTLEGPTGHVFWSHFRTAPDLQTFLVGLTRLTQEQVVETIQRFEHQLEHFIELSRDPFQSAPPSKPTDELHEYFEKWTAFPLFQTLQQQFPKARPAIVAVEQIVCPLAVIDDEYAEHLRPSLVSLETADIIKFALPTELQLAVKIAQDASGKGMVLTSREKGVALSNLALTNIPGLGIEVRMLISGSPQMILVSSVGGRLVARNGIHRAYLLASLGVREIPCVLIEEQMIPTIATAYPTFPPPILALPRPPLIVDAFDPKLTLTVPIIRTTKVIRISGEELVLPVD